MLANNKSQGLGALLIIDMHFDGDKKQSDTPRPIATLFDRVQIGISRDELMQKAYQLALHPVWLEKSPGVGVMRVFYNNVTWDIECTFRKESIH